MRWVKRTLWALAGVVLLVIMAVGGALVWLDSAAGKKWLEAAVNDAAAGTARISTIGGTFPFHLTIASVELLDIQGTWGRLQDMRLDIAAADLLRRRVTVQRVSAALIDIQRLPAGGPEEPPPRDEAPSLSLPQLPVAVDVRQLAVQELRLPAEVLGEPTAWTLDAAAHLIGRDLGLDLQVAGHSPSPVTLEASLALTATRAGVNLSLADPRGVLLHRALGEALPLHVQVRDDPNAPPDPQRWRGHITGAIGDRARLDASLHLAPGAESHGLATQGTFEGVGLLPPQLAALIGDSLGFEIAGRAMADGGFALETVKLDSAAFGLAGAGRYDADSNHIETSWRATIPDFAPLSQLAGQPLAGAATLDLTARGPLDAIHAEAELTATDARIGTTAAAALAARLQANLALGRGYELSGAGSLTGLRAGEAPLPAQLGESVRWRLHARSDAAGERVSVSELEIASAGVSLIGDGALDVPTQGVEGRLRLRVEDLRRFAPLAGVDLAGEGQVAADVAGRLTGPLAVRVDGGLSDLVTGIPAADALLQGRLRLEAQLRRGEDERVVIESASLTGGAARMTARGTIDAAANRLEGEVGAAVEDLAVLRRAGLETTGRVQVDAQVSGSLSAPAVDARVAGFGLGWASAAVDRLSLRLRGTTEGAPSGQLTAELQSHDLALRVEAQAALSADHKVLNVSQLRMRAGAAAVDARLRTTLDTLLTTGRISANVPDLAPWSSLAGMDLGGRVNLNAGLSARRGSQAAEVTFTGDALRLSTGDAAPLTIGRISGHGALTDVLRRPGGRLEVTADHIRAAGARIDQLSLAARSGAPNRFVVDGTAAGDFNGKFNLSTAGDVALDRGATRLTLARLTGNVAGTPLQLRRPLVFSANGPALALTDLALAVGEGVIEGSARRDASRLEIDMTGRRLPVALGGALAGQPDVGGTLDVQVTLDGPAAQPRGRVTIDGRDLRAGPVRRGQPVIGVSVVANIAPSAVDIEAALTTGSDRLLAASGTVPMTFGPAPGAVALDYGRALRLQVRGEGDLARFSDFLPLAGDRLGGAFRVALDAAGSVAQPQIIGSLSLDRGRYENRATGLVVDALALEVTADRERVVLRRLEATDGGKGVLRGSGTIRLNGGESPAADLTLTVAEFRALRRSDARLTATGSATVKGPVDALTLVARVAVDEAEFFIPDPPPTGARKIPVTVIDSATGRVLERPEEPAASAGEGVISLDVVVSVPGRTFIRGRGLDSEWEGDIRVQGTSAIPELTGALRVARGKFAFFGKDLALTRGTVSFSGGDKIEPDLDVLAETSNAGTTFQVSASGTPEDLRIRLSSVPPLPEDEILSRLIFGREMTRLTPAQGLQLAQAAATLSSGGPGMLDKMRQRLGLDTLNIGSGSDNDSLRPTGRSDASGGTDAMDSTGVSGGKYVADGVYVGAEQRLSGETRSKVEIEVLPNVTVETTVGTRGESVGVMWKKDY